MHTLHSDTHKHTHTCTHRIHTHTHKHTHTLHSHTIHVQPIPVWYVMDEFGSRIHHSDDPTIAMTTLFYVPAQMAFSFLWPLRDLKYGGQYTTVNHSILHYTTVWFSRPQIWKWICSLPEEVTRNCLPGSVRPGLERACHTLPWAHDSHMTLDNPLWSQLDEFRVPEVEVVNNSSKDTFHCGQYPLYTHTHITCTFLSNTCTQL